MYPLSDLLLIQVQSSYPSLSLSEERVQVTNSRDCCKVLTQTLTMWTILQLYWLCTITLKIQKGFSTIYLQICNVIYITFQSIVKNLQNSWYVSVLVMCECVCYCSYFTLTKDVYPYPYMIYEFPQHRGKRNNSCHQIEMFVKKKWSAGEMLSLRKNTVGGQRTFFISVK